MKRAILALITVMCLSLAGAGSAQEGLLPPIALPAPRTEGGMPLLEALRARRSERDFSSRTIPPQELSNLLWAAVGINRPESGKRTSPTARNRQEIDVYVVTAGGAFLYRPRENDLVQVKPGDLRALTGSQAFVASAPVNLVFVADYSRMSGSETDKDFYAAADTGFVSQNVYLYCASAGLSTVVRGLLDRTALGAAMGLKPEQKIVLAQSLGYPPEPEGKKP